MFCDILWNRAPLCFFTYVAFSAPIDVIFLLDLRHSSTFCVFAHCFLEYRDDVVVVGPFDPSSLHFFLVVSPFSEYCSGACLQNCSLIGDFCWRRVFERIFVVV